MDNINCEHCGSRINPNVDSRCPNCKAPYKNNKQYKEYLEYQKRQREIDLETKQIRNDITKDIHKTSKKVTPFVFSFVIVIFIVIIFFFYTIFKSINKNSNINTTNNNNQNNVNNDYFNDLYNDIINNKDNNQEEVKKEIIKASFNEKITTDEYDIKVDKIIKYTEKGFQRKNKLYYGFHIVFNNKTEEWKTLNNIKVVYTNDKGKEVILDKGIVSATKQLDFFATKIKKYEGYMYFQIPDSVKNITVTFDNINIKINKFRNKIK